MQTVTAAAPARKATKKEFREAVDSFLYRYDSLTGGTREEVARQAPHAIKDLEAMADRVTAIASNCNKAAAADEHLMRYAREVIPGKISLYRSRVPGTDEFLAANPSNVIQFPRVA